MKTATDTRLLFNRFSLQMLRNPVWLFVGFSTPILYLVLFTPLLDDLSKGQQFGGTSVLDVFLPGILALLAFASGSASGFSTIFELQSGVIERFRVTPASRFAILMGPILSGLVMMMAFDAVVIAVGTAFGFDINVGGLLVLAVLLAAADDHDGGVLHRDRTHHQGHQQLRGGHQRDQPARAPARRRAAPDLARSAVDAGARALQPPLLPRRGIARELANGSFGSSAVWQAFAVLVPLCALVLVWATRVFQRAVA